ncbi:Crp/Fnr family transcriptional regulator [Thalassobacillus devorans]|uniref:Crp/Fnr family transcriptional regulator n=1 Tax=Thalassobacillus devorans TaxID=279813 RepID=UPI0004B6DFC6|nr:Crp/Fnr family transcriptional regulator [Thalassobacillus devorans]
MSMMKNSGDRPICQHCHQASGHTCVARVPIFNHLDNDQMDAVTEAIRSLTYQKGDIIYRAGDPSDSLYIVNTGSVRIYRISDSGKEQVVRLLQPGDFTGEYALFSESLHESYAEANEPVTICTIRRNNLQDFLMRYPSIVLKILKTYSARLEQSEKQTTSLATESVGKRLSLYLAELAEASGSDTIRLPMNKKDLASFLGTTPETISRRLADLEAKGLIHKLDPKRFRLLDKNRLENL